MLAVLLEPTDVLGTIDRGERSFAVHVVHPPLTFVAVTLMHEQLSLSMALSGPPVSDVELSSVIETSPFAVSKIVFPISLVFIVAPLLLVCTEEHSIAITLVLAVSLIAQDRSFVPITIGVGKLVDSMHAEHIALEQARAWQSAAYSVVPPRIRAHCSH